MKLNLDELKNSYQKSEFRNDKKLKSLDDMDFMALIWQLETGQFELTPFSNKGFLRYFLTGTELPLNIVNNYFEQRQTIEKHLIN